MLGHVDSKRTIQSKSKPTGFFGRNEAPHKLSPKTNLITSYVGAVQQKPVTRFVSVPEVRQEDGKSSGWDLTRATAGKLSVDLDEHGYVASQATFWQTLPGQLEAFIVSAMGRRAATVKTENNDKSSRSWLLLCIVSTRLCSPTPNLPAPGRVPRVRGGNDHLDGPRWLVRVKLGPETRLQGVPRGKVQVGSLDLSG